MVKVYDNIIPDKLFQILITAFDGCKDQEFIDDPYLTIKDVISSNIIFSFRSSKKSGSINGITFRANSSLYIKFFRIVDSIRSIRKMLLRYLI